MYPSETFGFTIARPFAEVYEFLLEPTNFAKCAFVGEPIMRLLGGRDWAVETSVGPRIIRFAERNNFGVLDHFIMLEAGATAHPTGMWVVENGAGAHVLYTSFKRPGLTDIEWASVKDWVLADLLALQSLLESHGKLEPVFEARHVGLSIERPVREVYDFLAQPDNFAHWAFAGDAEMEPVAGGEWAVQTSVGPRVVRFGPRNAFGILSYASRLDAQAYPHPIPMRAFANGEGTELIYLFYKRPAITEEEWVSTIEWVSTDLLALKSLLEAG